LYDVVFAYFFVVGGIIKFFVVA